MVDIAPSVREDIRRRDGPMAVQRLFFAAEQTGLMQEILGYLFFHFPVKTSMPRKSLS